MERPYVVMRLPSLPYVGQQHACVDATLPQATPSLINGPAIAGRLRLLRRLARVSRP